MAPAAACRRMLRQRRRRLGARTWRRLSAPDTTTMHSGQAPSRTTGRSRTASSSAETRSRRSRCCAREGRVRWRRSSAGLAAAPPRHAARSLLTLNMPGRHVRCGGCGGPSRCERSSRSGGSASSTSSNQASGGIFDRMRGRRASNASLRRCANDDAPRCCFICARANAGPAPEVPTRSRQKPETTDVGSSAQLIALRRPGQADSPAAAIGTTPSRISPPCIICQRIQRCLARLPASLAAPACRRRRPCCWRLRCCSLLVSCEVPRCVLPGRLPDDA